MNYLAGLGLAEALSSLSSVDLNDKKTTSQSHITKQPVKHIFLIKQPVIH